MWSVLPVVSAVSAPSVVSVVLVLSVASVVSAPSVVSVMTVVSVVLVLSSRRVSPIATLLRIRSRRTSVMLWIIWISKKILHFEYLKSLAPTTGCEAFIFPSVSLTPYFLVKIKKNFNF
jgi:hypothetical protein